MTTFDVAYVLAIVLQFAVMTAAIIHDAYKNGFDDGMAEVLLANLRKHDENTLLKETTRLENDR